MASSPKTDRKPWPPAKDAALMDLVASDITLAECARRMNLSRNAVIGRFFKLRQAMGWQAA